MNIYNYKEIISRQKELKLRINAQADNIKWSESYINLCDYFPFYEGTTKNDMTPQRWYPASDLSVKIQTFIFTQEQSGPVWGVCWNSLLLFTFTLNGEGEIEKACFHLYNFPFHFGIRAFSNDDIYFLSEYEYKHQSEIPENKKHKLLKGTILYKNNFKKENISLDDFIIFNKFALKNYLGIIKENKLILKYDKKMEDYIAGDDRQLFIEVISNPCYSYQQNISLDLEKRIFEVPFLSIKNDLYKWNGKTVLHYIKNMPQQEYILDKDGKEYIMDFNKKINQYNPMDKMGIINKQNIRKDEIIYNFNQEYDDQNSLKMRII